MATEVLRQANIGAFVRYSMPDGSNKIGRVKSFNNATRHATVVFECNGRWKDFENYAGERVGFERIAIVNGATLGLDG